MAWYSTSGIVSPYQLVHGTTAKLEWSSGVDRTAREIPHLEEADLEKLFSASRLVRIRLRPEHNVLGFYLLLKGSFLQCLPDNYYIVKENELKILEQAGIPYHLVESSATI